MIIDNILLYTREDLIMLYNIPVKGELMSALIENPIYWYTFGSMSKSQVQN